MTYLGDWYDHIDEQIEQRLRQLGTRSPRCGQTGCGESNPLALTGVDPDILCYECRSRQGGRSVVEQHHVAGRHNMADDVAAIPGNDHRALSVSQYGWPTGTLRNPDASPLLAAAAALRGWLDVLLHIVGNTVGWIPPFLEWLDGALTETVGRTWWIELGYQR
jgi:hypothetical protein